MTLKNLIYWELGYWKSLVENTQVWHIQRSAKKCANLAKQDPGRVRQKSQARSGINFSQTRTNFLADLCRRMVYRGFSCLAWSKWALRLASHNYVALHSTHSCHQPFNLLVTSPFILDNSSLIRMRYKIDIKLVSELVLVMGWQWQYMDL